MQNLPIPISEERFSSFCERHHIRRLAFFGSVLRDDFGPDSDVDVLVDFDPEHIPGFLGLARIERELGEILRRKADLNTPKMLSPYFRDEILKEARTQYVAA